MKFVSLNSKIALCILTAFAAALLLFAPLADTGDARAQQPAATHTPTSMPGFLSIPLDDADALPAGGDAAVQGGAATDAISQHTHGGTHVTSQGVAAHGADNWHAAGYTGSGVKIGIMSWSNGFSELLGNELPSNVVARCFTADSGFHDFTSNLADCELSSRSNRNYYATRPETIFDVAPDATFYVTNKTGPAWLLSQGVDIIYAYGEYHWQGSGDGTSPHPTFSILTDVDAAVSGGAIWVHDVGNFPKIGWAGPFSDADSDGYLEFSGDIERNQVEFPAGERVTVHLRWEGPWAGGRPTIDLDMYLYDSEGNQVNFSTDRQRGGALEQSFESFFYTAETSGTYSIAVKRSSGPLPSWVNLLLYRADDTAELQFHTDGVLSSPADSANPGMLVVGGARWNDTSSILASSQRGPTTDGRTKPDIVGAACTLTRTVTTSNCNVYIAAAHVAGLAALVKQRFPNYTPAQIATYLKSNAEARGTVPNNTWGYGFAKLPPIPAQATPTATATRVATTTRVPTATATRVTGSATPTRTGVPTHTPTRTATRVATPSGGDSARVSRLEGQVGALQTQVAAQNALIETQRGDIGSLQSLVETLRGLINTLTARLDALDGGSSGATATPTNTPTLTPTTVVAVDATATPTPTRTTVPTATNTPVISTVPAGCIGKIGLGWITGTWTAGDCVSARTPPTAKPGTRYARFYAFTLDTPSKVTFAITSTDVRDAYLYLLAGRGNAGRLINSGDSGIAEQLEAGTYTLEVTTYEPEATGNFMLTMDIASTP